MTPGLQSPPREKPRATTSHFSLVARSSSCVVQHWLLHDSKLGVRKTSRMLKRTGITVAVWLVGLAFLTTNGQHFNHGIAVLLSAVLGAVPWVSLMRHQHSPRHRFAAVAVVALSAIVAVQVSLHLPRAYWEQQRINTRKATPNRALQAYEHLPRFARAVVRR